MGNGKAKHFGPHVRRLREANNLRLKDLAEATGFSIVYISDIETGNRPPPTQEKIVEIARVLGVDPGELKALASTDRKRVELDLGGKDSQRQEVALKLARRWDDFTEDELTKINKALED